MHIVALLEVILNNGVLVSKNLNISASANSCSHALEGHLRYNEQLSP